MKKTLGITIFVCSSISAADVPISPTADDELPPAINGNAGPLQGTDVAYYEANSDTRGYLAVPDDPGLMVRS